MKKESAVGVEQDGLRGRSRWHSILGWKRDPTNPTSHLGHTVPRSSQESIVLAARSLAVMPRSKALFYVQAHSSRPPLLKYLLAARLVSLTHLPLAAQAYGVSKPLSPKVFLTKGISCEEPHHQQFRATVQQAGAP